MTVPQPSDFASEINPDEYYFYHTIHLPGLGQMDGEWDLRPAADDYLGNVNLTNKRVLEMGAANGFLSFYERGPRCKTCSRSQRGQRLPVILHGKQRRVGHQL